jgi:hypothetical protein
MGDREPVHVALDDLSAVALVEEPHEARKQPPLSFGLHGTMARVAQQEVADADAEYVSSRS